MHLALANPCGNTVCKTLLEVYLLLAPPTPAQAGPAAAHPLSLVILNVFRLFIITIPKSIINVTFLSFVCPKWFAIQVCQPT